MNARQTSTVRGKLTRKVSVLMGALAIVGMGSVTVGCSSHPEQPVAPSSSSVTVVPTEKGCMGGPGSVHDTPGCAGKHHNRSGKNRAQRNNSGGGHSHRGGDHSRRGGGDHSHRGGGNGHHSGGGGHSHHGGGGRGHRG